MEAQTEEKPSLKYHERLFVLFVLLVFIAISLHVGWKKMGTTSSGTRLICVHVVGEIVDGKKDLTLRYGATYGDVLGRISCAEKASIKKMPIDHILRDGEYVVIPRAGCLSVYLKGQKNELLYVAEGTTFRDLYVQYPYKELKRKRRKLRDGEIITISKSF